MKNVIHIALATVGVVNASGVAFNYDNLGDNWPQIKIPKGGVNLCGTGKN